MQLSKLTHAVLGLVLAATVSCAPAIRGNTGDIQIPEGFTEVSEGVYFRNTMSVSFDGTALAPQTHYCQLSDFEDRTTPIGANVDDCWQLYKYIATDGEWIILDGHQKMVAFYRTCWVGITAQNGATVKVGNVDVRTAIIESITRFAQTFPGEDFQRVSSRGRFQCGYNYGDACTWGVYQRIM
ncbi:putative necrosis-inducing factor-domain-containing protein [Triangularia setosa]|uniref:Necrosis-inducing factor-domain-containing protein n=1 Tax=Triangularia setosa TaxID=2587417 RepID=A0AAN6WEB5_9PEZI|nr:putative necrosis-inducing factor-domain-containing protein [Podospora setosa]